MSPDTEEIEKKLKIIAVLFMALAGLCLLMLFMIPAHYMMLNTFSKMEFPDRGGEFNPQKMISEMKESIFVVYLIAGLVSVLFAGIALATGINLFRKRHRTFCIIGAACCCVIQPLGTALGIWALFILFDHKTKPLFEAEKLLDESDFLS
ncbi:MAG: hypothetical protein ABIK07_02365 [Planctomycetota bacterium]